MKFLALFVLACFSMRDWGKDWSEFKEKYNKNYELLGNGEESRRFEIFVNNTLEADRMNAEEGSNVYGITKFSDLTYAEMRKYHMGYKPNNRLKSLKQCQTGICPACRQFPNVQDVPASIDWDALGVVEPIKDQAQCGSCWTFSTVATMECAWYMGGNGMQSGSEEELVQCAKSAGDGCNGGEMTSALEWVIDNGGDDSESDYPYTSGTGTTGKCNKKKSKKNVIVLSDACVVSTDASGEAGMVNFAAQIGTLAIAVNAGKFQTYNKGILNPKWCSPRRLDHGVAIVGYGEENGTPYWKIRNSWGEDWGEDGYIRVARGSNVCGVAMDVSAAIVGNLEDIPIVN